MQKFLFLVWSASIVPIVKSIHTEATISIILSKNNLKQSWNFFNTKFQSQWKKQKTSFQVKLSLARFCNLIALILGWSHVEGLRVTKICNEIRFEGLWGELEATKLFPKQLLRKHFETNYSFCVKIVYCRKSLTFTFQDFFVSINKICFW